MRFKRSLGLISAVALAAALAACGSSDSSSTATTAAARSDQDRRLRPHQQGRQHLDHAGQVRHPHRRDHASGPGLVERHDARVDQERLRVLHGRRAGPHGRASSSVTVKNVSFDQLVAGHTNDFDIALAEISITAERKPRSSTSRCRTSTPTSASWSRRTRTSPRTTSTSKTLRGLLRHHLGALHPGPARSAPPTTIYPDSQTLYQSVLSGQVGRGVPRHRDRARRGEGDQRCGSRSSGQYETGEKYGAIYPQGLGQRGGPRQGHPDDDRRRDPEQPVQDLPRSRLRWRPGVGAGLDDQVAARDEHLDPRQRGAATAPSPEPAPSA